MQISEYLEKMKKYNQKEINYNICPIHTIKYVSYCFNCNKHLCSDCLKDRKHVIHNKNNIIEIEPKKEELVKVEEKINDYENEIDDLECRVIKINKDLKEKEKEKNRIIKLKEKRIKDSKINMQEELKKNKNNIILFKHL